MPRDEFFDDFLLKLRSDPSSHDIVTPDVARCLYRGFGDTERLVMSIVTACAYRVRKPSVIFEQGLFAISTDAIYLADADTFERLAVGDFVEWYSTGRKSQRYVEFVLASASGPVIHLKVPRKALAQFFEACQDIGLSRGEERVAEDAEDVNLHSFQNHWMHIHSLVAKQFRTSVPRKVRRQSEMNPELLTNWFLEKRWKSDDTP